VTVARQLRPNSIAPSLDRLMPMHIRLDAAGKIAHVAPTLAKVIGPQSLVGTAFFDEFHVAASTADMPCLDDLIHRPIRLLARRQPDIPMRGLALPNILGPGYLINLSFGVSVIAAIKKFDLNQSDFAPTDLAIEMMFLHEANQAAVAQWKNLASRLESAYDRAEQESLKDPLTGLGNRRMLDASLDDLMAEGMPFGLIVLDLDNFKEINDVCGHEAGDRALAELAKRLHRSIRKSDIAFRLGGDEFVLLLPQLTAAPEMEQLVRRFFKALRPQVKFDGHAIDLSASAGGALSVDYERLDPGQVLRDADKALYDSKRAGRGRFTAHGTGASLLRDGSRAPAGRSGVAPAHTTP
jgi:diguanylate cyclase (GGDEF)-like protein